MRFVIVVASVVASLTVLHSGKAAAQTATTPGTVTTPYPTSQGISIEWAISGDSNNNGVVTVRYRESGASAWKTGMPLIRVPAGSNDTGNFGTGGSWSNKHAGSLFDLDPGKTYEIELTLNDPDGGSMSAMATASTRPIPVASAGAVTKQVTPTTLSSGLSGAMPGDILLLGAGSYPAFTVSKSGTAGSPIVIRGASVDTVTIGGQVTITDRQYVYLENVTVMGEVRLKGSSNSVVRGCRIRTSAFGITFLRGNDTPRNNTIVDNDIVGAAPWVNDQLGSEGYDGGEGIQFTGSGHVVCFNHVANFRDNISFMEYDNAYEQVSIDICNNDIEQATDDAIEADSAMGNVRIFRNRIENSFQGISAQPNLGGPTFYVRNVMYNVLYSPYKFHNETVGDVVLHTTVVKPGDAYGCYGETISRAYFRNNVFIGGTGGGTYGGYGNGSGKIFEVDNADSTCSFDYDGVGSIGISTFSGRIGSSTFNSLATLRSNTTEKNAVQVDLSIFATQPAFPSSPFPPKAIPDLRIAAGSAVVDKGLAVPGLNDDFAGAAPDLGAYEAGAALPTYGPRVGGVVTGTGGSSGSGTGGSGGAAGSTGTGTGGRGGTSGSAGRGGTTGSAGRGGTTGTGGSLVTGRGGTTGAGTGGSTGASTGGSTGTGIAGSTGAGTGGDSGAAGDTGGSGSPSGAAGVSGSGVAGTSGSGVAGAAGEDRDLDGGCSCAIAAPAGGRFTWLSLLAAAALVRFRRRR